MPSLVRMNKKGEKGSPCLSPLLTWKSEVGHPLTKIDKDHGLHPLHPFGLKILNLQSVLKVILRNAVISLFEINLHY